MKPWWWWWNEVFIDSANASNVVRSTPIILISKSPVDYADHQQQDLEHETIVSKMLRMLMLLNKNSFIVSVNFIIIKK